MRICLLFPFVAVSLLSQAWADRAEYDKALAVRAEAVPAARLKLLADWKAKYPKSEMAHSRAELTLAAAQELGDSATMLQAATEMLSVNPDSFPGLFWSTVLLPASGSGDAALYARTATTARKALTLTPAYFPSKASGLSGDAVGLERTRFEGLAHRNLGWAAWKQDKLEEAEKELTLSLSLDPASAQASAWLGTLLAAKRAPERQSETIWHLARAAYLDGDGALPGPQRMAVRKLLDAVYASHHGSTAGLDDVGAKARASALPPAGFKVETAEEVELRRREAEQQRLDEEMEKTNPALLSWIKVRRRLLGKDGESQFQMMLSSGLPRLTGVVTRCNSSTRVTEFSMALSDATTEEVLVQLNAPQRKCPDPGTKIEFTALPVSYNREPFLLTVAATKEGIDGWGGELTTK